MLGTARGAELHLHGGFGSASAAEACLRAANFVREQATDEPAPRSACHAWALLSIEHGPLARLHTFIDRGAASTCNETALPDLLQQDIASCRQREGLGERLAVPPVVAIVGRPNAGKSTLFNSIVGSKRALVAPEAGTTRDEVRGLVELDGIAVELVDTAGAVTPIPLQSRADVVVHLLTEPDEQQRKVLPRQTIIRAMGHADQFCDHAMLAVSGLTGIGVPQLLGNISMSLGLQHPEGAELWAPVGAKLRRWLRPGKSAAPLR